MRGGRLSVAAAGLCLAACRPALPAGMADVTVHSTAGERRFRVELADTAAEQATGLMHRTRLAPDGGMLFAPYPADGGAPRRATFGMKDTPLPLDLVFIRADHVIDGIASGRPNDETFLSSDRPVAAVLEVAGGQAAALGLRAGDRVAWTTGR